MHICFTWSNKYFCIWLVLRNFVFTFCKNFFSVRYFLEKDKSIIIFMNLQELLQMFGLPYIIAPMEAEAQCAYMELANLVDGVVTDDSDVFLFGAKSVFKNIFDDRKYVETYFMKVCV